MKRTQIILAIGASIRSYRTAQDPVTRAQMRWMVWVAGVGGVILIPGYVTPLLLGYSPLLPHPITMLLVLLLPFAFAIAVLRYRLFDIEVIINRTLVYGTLTALLAGFFLLLVRFLTLIAQLVLHRQDDTLVVFIATLSIALAFVPLRRRVQTWIDRLFYRTKFDYQQLLPEMTERLSTSVHLDKLTPLLTKEVPHRLHISYATLAVLDPNDRHLVPMGAEDPSPLPEDHALIQHLRQTGQPLVRLQPPSSLPAEAQQLLERQNTELSIPLIVGAKLVGLYNLGPKLSGNAYNREEVRLLHLLGQQAAIAVENSRLFQETRRQAEELTLLHQASVTISSSLEREEVLRTLAEQLGTALDVSSVYIWGLSEDMERSTILARWSNLFIPSRQSSLGTISRMAQHPATLEALQKGRPLTLQASAPNLDPEDRRGAQSYGWRSRLDVPLIIRGRTIGYAELWETRRKREFTPSEIQLCQTIAADAAVAIEHARLFQAEREQRRFSQALEEAAAVVNSTLNLDQVLDRILEQVERVVPGDAINVMLIEEEYAQVVRWRGYQRLGGAERIGGLRMYIPEYPTLERMMQTGQPATVPDTKATSDWIPERHWEWLRSYVGAPIRIGGQTVGFLNIDGTEPGQFSHQDAQRLEAFAHHAATAIENARLFQDILRQADKLETMVAQLQELDRLKSEFVQTVSHELRSPIGLIRGYAELLNEEWIQDLSSEQKKAVRIIARRSKMLSELVEDITLMMALESRPPQIQPVAIPDLIQAVVEDFDIRIDEAGLTLSTDVSADLPPVQGEPTRLRRVLDNLLSNAIKFTPAGGRISIRAWSHQDRVTLEVEDNGIGIPADQQRNIFERFYQIDGSMQRRYGGVGLGLALVKEIVEAFGGTVQVESALHQGSTFTITLPVFEEK